MAESFFASQPLGMSKICFDRPHQVLGFWARWPSGLGFLYQRFSSLVGDEARQFRNQQSRTLVKWRPWFYLGLVAHSFFWLSERA
jgi:hypothetical protein